MDMVVELEGICKRYRSLRRRRGWRGILKALLRPEYKESEALRGVSLRIRPGEFVGLIGLNGSGKTTLLKVVSGLITADAGRVRTLGTDPFRREPSFLREIGFVMGNKNQLEWDLPARDTWYLNRETYGIDRCAYEQRVSWFTEMLRLQEITDTPVRNLSMGERMKCELAASLLHMPRLLLLDEATVGLDVLSKRAIHCFLKAYSSTHGATIIYTSHVLEDIRRLCPRTIVLDHGLIVHDGPTGDVVQGAGGRVRLEVSWSDGAPDEKVMRRLGHWKAEGEGKGVLLTDASQARRVAVDLIRETRIDGIAIQEPQFEDVVVSLLDRRHADRVAGCGDHAKDD
jgi:ABC-2 type transport system ATP-binding protein